MSVVYVILSYVIKIIICSCCAQSCALLEHKAQMEHMILIVQENQLQKAAEIK